MNVQALGIDVALSKPIAVASIDSHGTLATRKVGKFGGNGAQRLAAIRSALAVVLSQYQNVAVIAVETPFAKQSSGLTTLLQAQGVVLEAAQATHPGAVVLDPSPVEWKCGSVGSNAGKPAYIAHAQGLGLDSDDEDLAAAACLAQFGLEKWLWETRRAA